MTTHRQARFLLVPVVSAIALAGCSSTTTDTAAPIGTSTSNTPPVSLAGTVNDHGTQDLTDAGSKPTLSLEADDNYFGPTFVKAAPGSTIHVVVENEGTRRHTFTIDGTGIDSTIEPGAKAEADVTVPSSGTVNFYCHFHRDGGMQGAVFTGTASGAPPPSPSPSTTAPAGRDGY